MRYVSIDIETTGINKEWCDIIEFGAIIEDTENQVEYDEIPKFRRFLQPPRPEGYRGEIFALDMHAKNGIISELNRRDLLQKKILSGKDATADEHGDAMELVAPRKLLHEFSAWMIQNGYENTNRNKSGPPRVNLGSVTVAGKNFFAFDWNYLSPLFGERICRRSIDPSILFWNPAEDERVPSTGECLERAGLESSGTHTSLEDAWDVIRLVRVGMERRSDAS